MSTTRPALNAHRRALAEGAHGPGGSRRAWRRLAAIAADDLDLARLAEADLDARTILGEVGGPAPDDGDTWGVWAAESGRVPAVEGRREGGGWRLDGTKPWCSGATVCTHALVTAHADDGRRLFAVDLAAPGITARAGEWVGLGMTGSATATVDLTATPAVPVGGPRAYLDRAGFWDGAIAVAAVWFGGATAVAAPLRRAGRDRRLDAHGHAHLGAVDAALSAARAVLGAAADEVEARSGTEDPDAARRRALRVRAVVEHAVETAITRTGRATGPDPLAHDRDHARRVADLEVYVRQSHAERDLATLGELVADAEYPL